MDGHQFKPRNFRFRDHRINWLFFVLWPSFTINIMSYRFVVRPFHVFWWGWAIDIRIRTPCLTSFDDCDVLDSWTACRPCAIFMIQILVYKYKLSILSMACRLNEARYACGFKFNVMLVFAPPSKSAVGSNVCLYRSIGWFGCDPRADDKSQVGAPYVVVLTSYRCDTL